VVAGVAWNSDLVLRLSVGPDYTDAGILVVLQLLATATALAGTALRPVLLSMGLQAALLKIAIISALGFYVTFALALPLLGVIGACLAHILQNALWLLTARLAFARGIRAETGPGQGAAWAARQPGGSESPGAATAP
jgi:O-antigen/teichoic acid export membrane protein